jgi:hypothetical protein
MKLRRDSHSGGIVFPREEKSAQQQLDELRARVEELERRLESPRKRKV